MYFFHYAVQTKLISIIIKMPKNILASQHINQHLHLLFSEKNLCGHSMTGWGQNKVAIDQFQVKQLYLSIIPGSTLRRILLLSINFLLLHLFSSTYQFQHYSTKVKDLSLTFSLEWFSVKKWFAQMLCILRLIFFKRHMKLRMWMVYCSRGIFHGFICFHPTYFSPSCFVLELFFETLVMDNLHPEAHFL